MDHQLVGTRTSVPAATPEGAVVIARFEAHRVTTTRRACHRDRRVDTNHPLRDGVADLLAQRWSSQPGRRGGREFGTPSSVDVIAGSLGSPVAAVGPRQRVRDHADHRRLWARAARGVAPGRAGGARRSEGGTDPTSFVSEGGLELPVVPCGPVGHGAPAVIAERECSAPSGCPTRPVRPGRGDSGRWTVDGVGKSASLTRPGSK